jgi:arylsulfatase A-like enzyme
MSPSSRRPNLLFVFSDQHRWSDLGCYGNPDVSSPHLDALAANGLRFTDCICNSPLCVPARGSLLTGLLPLKHGGVGNDLPLKAGIETCGDVFRNGGYRTGYIGKWNLGGTPRDRAIPPQEREGFEEWKAANCTHQYWNSYYDDDESGQRHGIEGYEPSTQTSFAVDFIQRHKDHPWALWLSWGPPHDPYRDVPAEWLARYDAVRPELRPNVPDEVRNGEAVASREALRKALCGYYAHVSALDHEFGRLVQALESTDQLADTILVYTSDHGDMLGSHGFLGKQLPHEESVRVPLLVSWPNGNIQRGVSREMINLVDLPVTLAALAGLQFHGETDGLDLGSLFRDQSARGREVSYLFDYTACHQAATRKSPAWRGVRTRTHTLAKAVDGRILLFADNEKDPYQTREGTPEVLRELQEILDREVARHDAWLDRDDLLRKHGLLQEWNRSQRYFGLPESCE